jgi:GAF domain-containing protein
VSFVKFSYSRLDQFETVNRRGDHTLAQAMAHAALFLNEPAEDLETILARLADVAHQMIADVDMASISVTSRDGISTKAATDQAARDLDQLQYDFQEGPCLDALLDPDKAEVVVDDMSCERRWPRYAQAAAGRGYRSQMGIKIYREGRSAGGLNLYSLRANAFGDETRAAAEIFAVHAAIAMDKVRTVTNLTDALGSRQTIGQAVGIVMRTYTVDEDAAFNYLTRVSQTTNTKLRDVAAQIVAALTVEARVNRDGARNGSRPCRVPVAPAPTVGGDGATS